MAVPQDDWSSAFTISTSGPSKRHADHPQARVRVGGSRPAVVTTASPTGTGLPAHEALALLLERGTGRPGDGGGDAAAVGEVAVRSDDRVAAGVPRNGQGHRGRSPSE